MKNKIPTSTEFTWVEKEFPYLLKSCDQDDAVQLTLKTITDKNSLILEAGCGPGRVVKYLSDKGYKNVFGLELNKEAVAFANRKFPKLNIKQGNILKMPYKKNHFDAILSYGVVEHFEKTGLDLPLKEMYQYLKPGGIAIVSVPCHSYLRRTQRFLGMFREKALNQLFKRPLVKRNKGYKGYYVNPQVGKFFEYRLTKKEFETACQKAGFKIIDSRPISHIDGLYHSFGKRLINFENWEFKASTEVLILNKILKLIPYLHNHMQICILSKEVKI